MSSVAIVMNMFYTGVGIARSLGEHGIRVIGLSAVRRTYGNYTRYAEVRLCPNSRTEPEALLEFLLRLGRQLREPAVIFPTRDDDVAFLERFRRELTSRFVLLLPETSALQGCLDKWQTCEWAREAGVPSPRSWKLDREEDLDHIANNITFPCVMKPRSAHFWRKPGNWEKVGQRKAIAISSWEELSSVYRDLAATEPRALLQELVTGGDDCLYVAACYLDRQHNLLAGFTAQKLLQVPAGLGTGCLVRAIDRPDLLRLATQLLKKMNFSGIAEVEFKWDVACQEYKLIEINARPWDQHRLGKACGVDLLYTAYADLSGLPAPPAKLNKAEHIWVAEDVLAFVVLRWLWRRDGSLGALRTLVRGRRTYAVWMMKDPLPFLALVALQFAPDLLTGLWRRFITSVLSFRVDAPSVRKGMSSDSFAKAKIKH